MKRKMKRKYFAIITVISLIIVFTGCGRNSISTTTVESNNKEYSQIHDDIYEFIDPETGVHYWIYSHKAGSGGMGGMTPRLNSDGSIMVEDLN